MDILKGVLDAVLGVCDSIAEAVHGDDAVIVEGVRRSIQVDDYSCGAHAALVILRAFGRGRSLNATLRALDTDEDGTSETALRTLFRNRRLSTRTISNARLHNLDEAVEAGRLCLVSMHDDGHWAVVCGTSPTRIFMADSGASRLWSAVPRKQFKREWDGWVMVVWPRRGPGQG